MAAAPDIVRGSRPVQPYLRKFRQPIYDEEKVGKGVAYNSINFFARRRGEADNCAHTKTLRDTNLIANGALGAKQEFYLVGFTANLDIFVTVRDKATSISGAVTNELFAWKTIMNDSLFTYQFGRAQNLVEIPFDRVPCGMAPDGHIDSQRTAGTTEVAHIIRNGVPSVREFYDVRLKKNRPRHIQPEQAFTCELSWPNGAITLGTVSGAECYRIMLYMIGILLSSL